MNSLRTLILSAMCNSLSITRTLFAVVLLVAACLTAGPAMGQSAYFSLEGDFIINADKHDFLFDLTRSVGSGEDLRFRTYHDEGGTNAAGDIIALGSFDPVLELFDSLDASRGLNDEIGGTPFSHDSLLTWVPEFPWGLDPDPLPVDSYRLNLIEFANSDTGPWAVDLIGPADAIIFTGATPTGSSTVDSLKFGTTGGGTAVYNHSSGTLTLLDQLVVANTGNATLNVSGGVLTVNGTLTVNAGGTINRTAGTFNTNGNVNLNGGSFNLTGDYQIDNGTTFDVQSGGDLIVSGYFDIGSFFGGGGDGTLIVDGAGSSVTTGLATSFYGDSGFTADVTFRNGATGSLGNVALGNSATAGTTGIFNVESGAAVTMGALGVALTGGATTSSTVTVDGAGSTITQNGALFLTVGHASTGSGTINVTNGGTFNTSTGTTTLNPTGTILVDGGTFNFNGSIVDNGGTLNFLAGTINVAQNFTIGAGGLLGTDLTLAANRELGVGGTTTIDASRILTLTGGTFNTGDLTIIGTFDFQTGTLGITGAGGLTIGVSEVLGSLLSVDTGQTIRVTNTAYIDSGASLDVLSGGTFNAGTLANDGSMDVAGTANVTNATVGAGASIDVPSGGTFNAGTTTINATGTINVGLGGYATFNTSGPVAIDGGTLNQIGNGDFNLASGQTLTATNNAQINFDNTYNIKNFTFDIQSGADISADYYIDIGDNGDGTLLVDGAGSSVTTLPVSWGAPLRWGWNFGTADVTFRNSATGSFGPIRLADINGTTGIFNVQSAATVTTGSLWVASAGNTTTAGTITIDGSGSSLTQNGASTLTLGHATDGTATINVTNGGTFSTGAGIATLNPTGTIFVDGGTFNFNGAIVDNGVTLNFLAGTINVAQNFTIGAGGLLGTDLTLAANRELGVGGTTTIDASRTLTLTGGTFNTGDLTIIGTFDFQTGTLGITGAGGLTIGVSEVLGSLLSVDTGQTISVTNTAYIDSGGSLDVLLGGTFNAGTLANGGSMVVTGDANVANTATVDAGGSLDVLLGGTFNAGTLAIGGSMVVSGTGAANVTNTATIDAGASLGVQFGGSLEVTGATTNSGTVNIWNTTVDFTGGFTNSNADLVLIDAIFNGDITNPAGSALTVVSNVTLNGLLSGAGGIFGPGTLTINGGHSPGDSAAEVPVEGNLVYGNGNTLTIELGGLLSGEFDRLVIAGDATLDGNLLIDLLNDFTPSFGNEFEILDISGTLSGQFLGLDEGALVDNFGGMDLFITYTAGSGNDVSLYAVPEPATMILLAVSGLALLRRRNR
ncbi:hypothetical protein LCGC14_0456290 [marine sediment metagenome]|uniref:Ice-binding protein C-terminal domain-containing protein n=1 Tax=marine sediment metagenome TaxID=412755 RepID=A0A0F9SLL7_9ZZZZ